MHQFMGKLHYFIILFFCPLLSGMNRKDFMLAINNVLTDELKKAIDAIDVKAYAKTSYSLQDVFPLQHLTKYLKPGVKVLNLGLNNVYVVSLFAHMINASGTIVAVDFQSSRVSSANEMVKKDSVAKEFLSNRLKIKNNDSSIGKAKSLLANVPKDGQIVGHTRMQKQYGDYDIIYAQDSSFYSKNLENDLKFDGILLCLYKPSKNKCIMEKHHSFGVYSRMFIPCNPAAFELIRSTGSLNQENIVYTSSASHLSFPLSILLSFASFSLF